MATRPSGPGPRTGRPQTAQGGTVDAADFPPGAWRPPVPFNVDGGRYRAEVEVGLVATGAVFTGRDTVEAKPVGIHMFHPAFFGPAHKAENLARLERTLRYQHPNLAPTFAVGEAYGSRFAVTAGVVGQPLTHWRRDAGELTPGDIYRLTGQIIQAVAAIHAEGGVHGSLSPDTLRVVNDQALIVNPWTLDAPADLPAGELPPPRTAWLAPELLFPGGAQGTETDVYGVGLALGYLLARGLTEPGHSLLVQGIDVAPAVDDVYVRATARQREARYRDLSELAAALEVAAGPEWRVAQKAKPVESAPRVLTLEVLESVPVVAAPVVIEVVDELATSRSGSSRSEVEAEQDRLPGGKRPQNDVESTSEDEAIPAHATPATAVVVAEPEAGAVEALPRAGKRRVAKTLVSGSPREMREEAARGPVPQVPMPERSVSDTDTAPPPTPGFVAALASHSSSSLESLDRGLLASLGGPPPLPPGLPPGPPPTTRSKARPTVIGMPLRPPTAQPMLPTGLDVATDPPVAVPVAHPVEAARSAPVETHEPTIVEPFAPSLLELDVFGVADSGPPKPEVKQVDPFNDAPPPAPAEWSDSPFAVSSASAAGGSDIFAASAAAGPVIERPFTDQSMSAGSLRLRRPDPVTRPKERAYGSTSTQHSFVGVPPTRKRFPWPIVIAVLAGVAAAAVIFAITSGGDEPRPEPTSATVLAATTPATTNTTAVVVPTAADASAEVMIAAPPDTQVAETSVVDSAVTETSVETVEETTPDTTPEVVPDVVADSAPETIDTAIVLADALLAATMPQADVTSPADVVEPVDTAVAVVADTAEAPDTALPIDWVPKDPAKLSCPPGMSKMKKKVPVTLADGKKVDDWEVVCIDAYEFPGAGAVPRTNVDISGARAACIGKGKRLCTKAEWRRGCGGKYPYGSTYDPSKCATANADGSPGQVVAAGSKRGCRGGAGAFDMVGNVAEWTSDGSVNGGSAFKNGEDGTCGTSSKRVGGAPYVGFRCCADAK